MHHVHYFLLKRLGALPKETVLYVGHEYTVRNLSFAAFVEPENKRIAEKERKVK